MGKRFGLVIDQERCIGCEACTVACTMENHPSAGPWIKVQTLRAAHKDIPTGSFPELIMDFMPHLCMHCREPLCLAACPCGAIVKREDGPVVLVEADCTGCQACLVACPYGAISFSDEKGKAEKCNFCFHRLEQGLEPFCVICCEGQAMHFGDLADPSSSVSRLCASEGAFQLPADTETDPAVFYCRPKEKRRL